MTAIVINLYLYLYILDTNKSSIKVSYAINFFETKQLVLAHFELHGMLTQVNNTKVKEINNIDFQLFKFIVFHVGKLLLCMIDMFVVF